MNNYRTCAGSQTLPRTLVGLTFTTGCYPYHLKFLPRRVGFGLAVTAIRHRELTICLRVKLDPACGQVPIDIDNEGLGSVLSFRGIF